MLKPVSIVAGLAALFAATGVLAQGAAFPSKPVRVIVSSAPGALTDIAARVYAERMAVFLKQPVVIENMAAGVASLSSRAVARAPADGYTILASTNTLLSIPHLSKTAGYEMKDFIGIGELCRSPNLVAVPSSSPFKSLPDLFAAVKKAPNSLSYASGGIGTTSHLPMEMLMQLAGITMVHVPYKGNAPAIPDLISGRTQIMMATAAGLTGPIKAGQLRGVAITSEIRSVKFPDLPTLKELGYAGASYSIFAGLLGPAALPKPVIDRLAEAIDFGRNDRGLRERLEGLDQEFSDVRTPVQFQALLRTEEEKQAKLIRDAKIQTE